MNFIRIENPKYIEATNTLINLDLVTDEGTLPYTYHPDDPAPACQWIKENINLEEVAEFVPVIPTLEEVKEAKLAEIASARYAAETAGLTLNGYTIATDDRSQLKVVGAAMAAMQDETYTCEWKMAGGFVTLDSATIIGIANAVRGFVQGCFDHEAELVDLIDEAETVEDIQKINWETEV